MKHFKLFIFSLLLFFSNMFVKNASAQFHWDQPLNCSECHSCEKPTHQDPCLKVCPTFKRKSNTKDRSINAAPKIVIIDTLSDKFEPVHFDHHAHAAMGQMQNGCETCHHHNPEGKILACSQCHKPGPASPEFNKPSLKGAMHQKCIGCHKTWEKSWEKKTDCTSCHEPKEGTLVSKKQKNTTVKIMIPNKFLFHSGSEEGDLVTFHHSNHIDKYGITCESCHQKQSCQSCHGEHEKAEVDHDNCVSCHENDIDDNCQKCHGEKEKSGFNHNKTGWKLNRGHQSLKCSECHGNSGKFTRKVKNCTLCHKNFIQGKFNHAKIGLILNEDHNEFDCDVCHENRNFKQKPSCDNCHDDYHFPKQKPGKLIRMK